MIQNGEKNSGTQKVEASLVVLREKNPGFNDKKISLLAGNMAGSRHLRKKCFLTITEKNYSSIF